MKLFDDDICPQCNKKLIDPKDNDPVFLIQKNVPWSGILEEAMTDNNIRFYKKETYEGGLSAVFGYVSEVFDFYVPFSDYKRAKQLTEDIFSEVDAEDNSSDEDESETEEDQSIDEENEEDPDSSDK